LKYVNAVKRLERRNYSDDARPHVTDCPPRAASCRKCGIRGHFASVRCANRNQFGRKALSGSNSGRPAEKKRDIFEIYTNDEHDMFAIESKSIDLYVSIGGQEVPVTNDSGARSNCIKRETWKLIQKREGIKELSDDGVKLRAYGQNEFLRVIVLFEAEVSVQGRSVTAKFRVIDSGRVNILDRETSEQLGILKLGLNVNLVEQQEENVVAGV
jgi:hypothetical protein